MTQPVDALATGDLQVLGRLPEASNLALLAEIATDGGPIRCIYKPVVGERPLWDFPGAALAAREVLTAKAAACFGWDLIPATVWRDDGPLGAGMCQEWVESVDGAPVALFARGEVPEGWGDVAEGVDASGAPVVLAHEMSDPMAQMVVLDALVNNADRKGGHVLRRPDGRVAAIDHGVTFHAENKLRTVLWGWAGMPIPQSLLGQVSNGAAAFIALVQEWGTDTAQGTAQGYGLDWDDVVAREQVTAQGSAHLSGAEVRAATDRLESLLREAAFPMPAADWPALPWPPM